MSKNIKIQGPDTVPSNDPSKISSREIAEYSSAAKKSSAQYENRIHDLRVEVKMYRSKSEGLQSKLDKELEFRPEFTRIDCNNIELMIQLATVTIFTGLGGLFMGVFPKQPKDTPTMFIVGATLVGVGVVLSMFVTPIRLLINRSRQNNRKQINL